MDQLRAILKTATLRESALTLSSTILNGFLGFFFYTLLAKSLGLESFGLLTVSIATLTLVADVVDFGVNTTIVKFVSKYQQLGDGLKVHQYLKLGLEIKLIVWIIYLALGISLAPLLATVIFQKPELIIPLRLVFLGVGGAMFLSFGLSSLQALSKFKLWGFVNLTTNLFRLIVILILISLNSLSLDSSLLTFILLPFFGFLLSLIFLPIPQIIKSKNEFQNFNSFFKFSKFVALFSLIAALSSRMDLMLVTRILNNRDLGIYSAALQFTVVIPQLIGAIGVVISPKFSSFDSKDKMLKYFKKLQFLLLAIFLIGLLAIPLSPIFIPMFLGSNFTESIPIFNLLYLAMLVFLISVPLHNAIIYFFTNPLFFVYLSILHLLIISLGGYFLITTFGILGAAAIVLIGMLVNLFIPLIYFVFKIHYYEK